MNNIFKLYKYLPNDYIDWELIKNELIQPFVKDLESTQQDKIFHSEGNVLNHTIMVCEKLIKLQEYQELTREEKLTVFLAGLFHDIGKIYTTKEFDGRISSPNHGVVGSVKVRNYLWTTFDLAGDKEYQSFREAICFLVKYHSVPVHEYDDLTKKVIRLSLNSSLSHHFSLKLLSILAKADVLGRESDVFDNHLENIELFIEEAKILDCFDKGFIFSDSYTKYQYLNSDSIWHYQSLYNNHYGTVYLICGLPGTGKDTYIKNHFPDLNVISLDDIRKELKVSPNDDQGYVYNYAKEKAKELLRNKKSFVWNATNLSNMIRDKQLNLFHDYNASVKIIFLETNLKTNLERNKSRNEVVREDVILKLLSNINIPEAFEAEEVEWICL